MTSKRIVRSVAFLDDAVSIEFMTPADDAKEIGVVMSHNLIVPAGDQYDDEIDNLLEAVTALLEDVLEDFPGLTPVDLSPPDPEEDDEDDV